MAISFLRDSPRTSIRFATLTHAAGISSTGDAELDARLPFDEPYRIPASTADLVNRVRREGGRIIAIGTTVVRALETAVGSDGTVEAGKGVARGRILPRVRNIDVHPTVTHLLGIGHGRPVDGTLATEILGESP